MPTLTAFWRSLPIVYKVVILLGIVSLILLPIALLTNHIVFPTTMMLLGPSAVIVLVACLLLHPFPSIPRISLLIKGYILYLAYFLISGIFCYIALYTSPYPTIDAWLKQSDAFFGFHLPVLMNWVYAQPGLSDFFWKIYDSLALEVMAIPLVLSLLGDRKALEIYINANMLAMVVGLLIYFFFPTSDPSSVFKDPHFISAQLSKVQIVNDIHHHLPFPYTSIAVVGFPSFHVVWASLSICAFWRHRYWLWPIVILNVLIIFSTMATGWHYLTDVLGGLAMTAIFQTLAVYWQKRFAPHYAPIPWKQPIPQCHSMQWLNNTAALFLMVAIALVTLVYIP